MDGERLSATAEKTTEKQVTRTFCLSFNGSSAWNCESPAPANVIQAAKGGLSNLHAASQGTLSRRCDISTNSGNLPST